MSAQRESLQTFWVNGSTEISKRASDLASAPQVKEQTFEAKANAGEFVVKGADSVQFWTGSDRKGENYIGDTKGDGVVFLKEGIQMVVKGGKVLGPLPAGTLHRCNTPPAHRSRSPTPPHRIVVTASSSTHRPPHLPRSSSANNPCSSYRLASGSERRVSGSGGHGSHDLPVVGSGVRYVSGTGHAHVTTTTTPPTTTNTHTIIITKPTLPSRSASYHPHVPPTNTFPNSVSVSCRECRQCLEQQQQRRESHPRDNSHHHHATYHATTTTPSYHKRHDGDTFSTAPTYLSSGPAQRDWLDDDSIAPEDSISNVGIYPNGYPSGHVLHAVSLSSRR
ncbi:hypothetical protein QBC32DRAFT_403886 [Pseudoneurospora amorphoporcata]|uniref:Uncharacterized protein n=1 Tax=Pseudoneurospora amorphoporcata TaxID=241081 RepID=A0AAN6SID1_9PEZI|nr:hypothetical protein QBC32DRAFT_403886 [Pseudoneurospora amorphoporcata]